MAMKKPTLRERIIHDVLEIPDDQQLEKIYKLIEDYKISRIPSDSEPLTREEKAAIKEAEEEFKRGDTVPYDEVFKDVDHQ